MKPIHLVIILKLILNYSGNHSTHLCSLENIGRFLAYNNLLKIMPSMSGLGAVFWEYEMNLL